MAEGMTEHWYVVKNEPHAKWKQMNSNRKETKHKGTNKGLLSPTNTPPQKKKPLKSKFFVKSEITWRLTLCYMSRNPDRTSPSRAQSENKLNKVWVKYSYYFQDTCLWMHDMDMSHATKLLCLELDVLLKILYYACKTIPNLKRNLKSSVLLVTSILNEAYWVKENQKGYW